MNTDIYTFISLCICVGVCMHVCACVCARVRVSECVFACPCVNLCVCKCARVWDCPFHNLPIVKVIYPVRCEQENTPTTKSNEKKKARTRQNSRPPAEAPRLACQCVAASNSRSAILEIGFFLAPSNANYFNAWIPPVARLKLIVIPISIRLAGYLIFFYHWMTIISEMKISPKNRKNKRKKWKELTLRTTSQSRILGVGDKMEKEKGKIVAQPR